jgi:hypothetical protein
MLHEIFCAELHCHDYISLECNKQPKQSDCSFIHIMYHNSRSYYVSQFTVILCITIHGHIIIFNDIVSIFPATVLSTFFKMKRCRTILWWHWKWLNGNMTLVNERQQIMLRHTQNVVSLRVLYKFVNLNLAFVICLKFCFYWNVR